jgi:acetyltransferase-like isoleucine patch superfamily enzyme
VNATRVSPQLEPTIFIHPQALVESSDIGPHTRIWAFAHVMAGARIGADCNICEHAFIEAGVELGNNVTVKNGVSIWDGVRVEDNVFLGPYCVLTNDPNPRSYIKKSPIQLKKTLICANAAVGANATILCDVTIGHYAFVGAGSVVLRSVPDHALIVGNPGRQIGWTCVCAAKLPLSSSAPLGSSCKCSDCDTAFVRTTNGLIAARTSVLGEQ